MDYQVKFNRRLSLSVQNSGIIVQLNEVTHCGKVEERPAVSEGGRR